MAQVKEKNITEQDAPKVGEILTIREEEKTPAQLKKEQKEIDKATKKLAEIEAKAAKKAVKEAKKAAKAERSRGDRKDGKLLRDIDAMHVIMPMLYPKRCDNEAFIAETIDLTNMEQYLKEYNDTHENNKASVFMIIVAAALKTVTIRDRMNRFIVNGNTYQRNETTASFVVKKHFNDNGEEGLAFVHADPEDTLETLCKKINKQINGIKSGEIFDASSESMDRVTKKFPRPILKMFVWFMRVLDRFGKVPQSLIDSDPYYSSILLTYVGSLRLQSGYHHLTNWGTNSFFVSVGEKKLRPFYDRKGEMTMRSSIDIALTIDERIADGYYYGKTIRLFKKLIENPELLELPLNEAVRY